MINYGGEYVILWRIGGKKKVNALKDGLLILIEIVKYFLRIKNKYS